MSFVFFVRLKDFIVFYCFFEGIVLLFICFLKDFIASNPQRESAYKDLVALLFQKLKTICEVTNSYECFKKSYNEETYNNMISNSESLLEKWKLKEDQIYVKF